MKLACVQARSPIWRRPRSARKSRAPTPARSCAFGPDYIIPKPFDSRLILRIAPAVAAAAAASGVATRPIADLEAYRQELARSVLLRPACSRARCSVRREPRNCKRIAYAEGEDERVLRAAQVALDEDLASPILIGRPAVIEARIKKAGLRMKLGADVDGRQPGRRPALQAVLAGLPPHHGPPRRDAPMRRKPRCCARRPPSPSLMVHLGDADGMLCGLHGRYRRASGAHPRRDRPAGRRDGARDVVGRSRSTSARCSSPTPT